MTRTEQPPARPKQTTKISVRSPTWHNSEQEQQRQDNITNIGSKRNADTPEHTFDNRTVKKSKMSGAEKSLARSTQATKHSVRSPTWYNMEQEQQQQDIVTNTVSERSMDMSEHKFEIRIATRPKKSRADS